MESIKNKAHDDFIVSNLGNYPPEFTTGLLDVLKELDFRGKLGMTTCESNAQVNYDTTFGEFSNSTINALFESVMATLDGNYGGRS